jgi:hypothetical protein
MRMHTACSMSFSSELTPRLISVECEFKNGRPKQMKFAFANRAGHSWLLDHELFAISEVP